jgi:hypothetical protein
LGVFVVGAGAAVSAILGIWHPWGGVFAAIWFAYVLAIVTGFHKRLDARIPPWRVSVRRTWLFFAGAWVVIATVFAVTLSVVAGVMLAGWTACLLMYAVAQRQGTRRRRGVAGGSSAENSPRTDSH